jgi:hypothetical protein
VEYGQAGQPVLCNALLRVLFSHPTDIVIALVEEEAR